MDENKPRETPEDVKGRAEEEPDAEDFDDSEEIEDFGEDDLDDQDADAR